MLGLEERIITTAVTKVRKRMRDERQKEREREAAREQGTALPTTATDNSASATQPSDSHLLTEEERAAEEALIAELAGAPSATGGTPAAPSGISEQQTEASLQKLRPTEEKFQRQEQLLIQMVVRYGERVMCNVEDENGDEKPLTVVEFIQYSLAEDHLELRHPLHRQILAEALQYYREEGFRCDRYFENHPELPIAELTTELAHDPETLSKIHEKGIPVKPEEERLVELVPHLLADYKLAVVEDELRSILQQMKDPAVITDRERSTEVMRRYSEIKQIQSQLSRQRGDRVIN